MNTLLILGDCLNVMATLDAGSVDAVVTDLPYQQTASDFDKAIPFGLMWEQVERLLKPKGVFVTTASQPFTSALVMSNLQMFRHEWIWDKLSATSPANSQIAPKKSHESILVFGQPGHVYNPVMWDAGKPNARRGSSHRQFGVGRDQKYKADFSYKADGNARYPLSVIRLPYQTGECNNTLRIHPTQKPQSIYEYLVRTYTNPGDTVLDFCAGSFTTGVACIQTGRNFIGIEKDSHFFRLGSERIAQAQMQMPLLEVA